MREDSTYFQSKYTKHWLKESATFEKSQYYKIVRKLILSYRPRTAIELGIGTGYPNALLLAKAGIKMFGVDIAEKLLKQCKDRFQKHGLDVTVEVADMCKLPFEANSFDCVFCISSSWYVGDIESLISEMFRVCRYGGGYRCTRHYQFLAHQRASTLYIQTYQGIFNNYKDFGRKFCADCSSNKNCKKITGEIHGNL